MRQPLPTKSVPTNKDKKKTERPGPRDQVREDGGAATP